VTEIGEHAAEPSHRRGDLRVQLDRGGAVGVAQRERDSQTAGFARGSLGVGLAGRRWSVQLVGMVTAQDVEHERGVGDRAGQRAEAGEAVERLAVGPGGDAPALGLDANEIAP
jgi:hypothetical protein